MPTGQQKRAFDIKLKKIQNKKPVLMGKIMREAGYSKKASENPNRLVKSKGWKQLLAQIDDEPLLDKLREIAVISKDKRANIAAIQELFKLKDKYPQKATKFEGLFKDL